MKIEKFEDRVECHTDSDGAKYWYKDGSLHRDGELPTIERNDGTKYWHKNDKLHRDNNLQRPSFMVEEWEWWSPYGRAILLKSLYTRRIRQTMKSDKEGRGNC